MQNQDTSYLNFQISLTSNYPMTSPSTVDANYTTLTKFIFSEESRIWAATGELTRLLNAIQISTKTISSLVRRCGMPTLFGTVTEKNKDKEPKKLQTSAHDVFVNMLSSSHSVGLIVSEESQKIIEVEKENKGKYIVAVDPLDGFSNVDCSIAVGSIFLVMVKDNDTIPTSQDIFYSGNKIAAAGYALYGSSTAFVFSTGDGVNGFILDPLIGEYILTDKNMKIPKKGSIYSVNEGYATSFEDSVKEYILEKKFPSAGKPYSSRYVGSMVADVHRTLKHGGIFMYPATKENPKGKLRLLYECKPMAYIMVQAGGTATDGKVDILGIKPEDIHQKTPIFLGSKKDVEDFVDLASKTHK